MERFQGKSSKKKINNKKNLNTVLQVQFGRNYNETENNERFLIFSETLKTINEHNKKYDQGEVSYTMGINQFADKTPEELKKSCCGKRRMDKH